MYKLLFVLAVLSHSLLSAQPAPEKPRIILGQCQRGSLTAAPFDRWFDSTYTAYQPDAAITEQLKKQSLEDVKVEVFFGTWCGDSRREVPAFLKLLDRVGFPENNLALIGVGNADTLLKQSPEHEEEGKGIFRVPVMIFYQNGREINRINEFTAYSLEKDMLDILTHSSYHPNYRSFALIRQWMNDGTLDNRLISARSLAGRLETMIRDRYELNSLGKVLLKQDKKQQALRVFHINYYLFPESPDITRSFGEALIENGEYSRAVRALERTLELNTDPKAVKEILEILYKAKEKS